MPADAIDKPVILVVEDDDHIAYLVQFILEQAGYAVHRAVDGKEALEFIARGQPPALATLDIALPDTTGVELIVQIKATPGWERVPIVMVTASPRDTQVNWAIKTGAKAYIVKPFRPEELLAVVGRLATRKPAAST